MLKNVLLIVNPGSGKGLAKEYALRLKEILEEHHASSVLIRHTKEMDDAYNWAKDSYKDGFDTVVTLGGDGTVNETVSGLMMIEDNRPCFSFLPLGTVNDLARALNMPLSVKECIEAFVTVKRSMIDIGRINQQYFINTVAVGSIAESVMETSSVDKNKIGRWAYFRDGIVAAFSEESYQLIILDSNNNRHELETNLLLVGLTNSVGGFEKMNPGANVNDGYLHLTAVRGRNLLDLSIAMIEGKLLDLETDKLFSLRDTFFRIESSDNQSISSNVDGDLGSNLPLEIEICHNALEVYVPHLEK